MALVWSRRAARRHGPPAGRPPLRGIAVLPLTNLSGDPAQEYFADGMTEALISDLDRVPGLRVISRTSVMQYKGTTKRMSQIARELKVDAIVEGSVMRAGSNVRIAAKLIDAARDEHLWVQTYERDQQDVLALERDISLAIANGVRATLTPVDAARMAPVRKVNPLAHEEYLKGRYALAKFTESDLRAALEHFNASLAAEPDYAPAYTGIADTYTALRSIWVDPKIVMPPAKKAAERAIELDETLAEAHVSLGSIKAFYDFDWDGAERELSRAIALNPNLAEAHHQNAMLLSATGRPQDAIAEILRAKDLDPLSSLIMSDVSWIYYCAKDYPRALEAGRTAERLDPKFWFAVASLGLALEKMGRLPEAIATLERARTLDDGPDGPGDARRRVRDRGTDRRRPEGARAAHQDGTGALRVPLRSRHGLRGTRRQAPRPRVAEKSYDAKADCTPWMNVDPKLDTLRGDPEFKALAGMMKFKP